VLAIDLKSEALLSQSSTLDMQCVLFAATTAFNTAVTLFADRNSQIPTLPGRQHEALEPTD